MGIAKNVVHLQERRRFTADEKCVASYQETRRQCRCCPIARNRISAPVPYELIAPATVAGGQALLGHKRPSEHRRWPFPTNVIDPTTRSRTSARSGRHATSVIMRTSGMGKHDHFWFGLARISKWSRDTLLSKTDGACATMRRSDRHRATLSAPS